MEKYQITGSQPLTGEIRVAGAKNAALKILAASILSDKICRVSNIPKIEDIKRMAEILEDLGVKMAWGNSTMEIDPAGLKKSSPDWELTKKLRSSIMLAGPLLARFGEVTMSQPGGCIIGQRPIDLFLAGFKTLGAELFEHNESFTLKAKKLKGAKIVLPKISVTVTESLMMTACLAEGLTTIINAAMEPEIPALADYLNNCGAKIKGAGTPWITIEGVDRLSAGEYELIPDRIEAGSFIMLGLATNSQIKVSNCRPEHLETVLAILKNAGANLEIGPDYIATKPSFLRGTEIQTHEYPGFPTDLQAPFTVLMTQAKGRSLIHETIFEGRLFYTDKLTLMGADIIMCDPHRVIVEGGTKLRGKKLESPDLRAGMALIIAGLCAEGETIIDNIYQIERGYAQVVPRLKNIGAKIEKISG
ncbi:MAG: UDP-N-acetylglucosamine 1-carboxyvinyltransferase [Candidatus Buchananbacteria bacterium RIFCSPHIGHO2_02_FULL_40_13]|uniref:UDP-N-acetylglucosamine 1-carboxyvinyltransferase n=1 Tax=Candidatus Buchananbacteria bacterium RIFCSPLOWO2_01_FULL_39_33 TaxID=1797543 RepID=A0A1G1YMR5_9BACT|nr:MAG: UDP-N-acetylglucosamine 1-carboxyvinyltransferase [Candidatus Buchananbacteria bacterium RIFCSPHIGHO2_01_FULL_40_35]OGY50883.1 MAG: UDP-N-acetylglucosamine 1-carboxyvinyltransferase [Candidatus Buchananbacteria bacterium RIFCSPHIGHO2_02_FULL_40_13]OGY52950.1 MAG: UDP-N-acetylglucosamine 1-carboxyvinyltransferase [Candidatus Buchananbacteria bacterium RIFCSPLOWO2_01_FULL_39_33]